MDEDFHRRGDGRRPGHRAAASSADGRADRSSVRAGCSIVSVAAVAIIIALAATGMLDRALAWVQATVGGRKSGGEAVMTSNCRQLVAALMLYAGDHNESYPESLHDLAPEPLSEQELSRLLTEGTAADSGESCGWILTPRLTTSSSATDILIISARPAGRKHHIAGLNDGSVIPVSIDTAADHLARLGL